MRGRFHRIDAFQYWGYRGPDVTYADLALDSSSRTIRPDAWDHAHYLAMRQVRFPDWIKNDEAAFITTLSDESYLLLFDAPRPVRHREVRPATQLRGGWTLSQPPRLRLCQLKPVRRHHLHWFRRDGEGVLPNRILRYSWDHRPPLLEITPASARELNLILDHLPSYLMEMVL